MYIATVAVMVHARSRSFQRTIKGRLWRSLRWWPPHHCSVPPLPPATFIGLISELRRNTPSTLLPPKQLAFLSFFVITNQHHVLSTAAQPQHHHAPHTFHVPGQSHRARISLEVMSRGHHKDLRGFTSASFGTIRNTSLLVICSFYYHMLFTITPYMFMSCLYINTPVCCMYFSSSNINLATYFS